MFMVVESQTGAIEALRAFAKSDKHSLIISGESGVGKTYLAREYSQMLGISDFVVVKPTVDELNETMDSVAGLDNKICVCIENLDLGVVATSYTILKFVEEPRNNIYIVITCRNIDAVPSTILSRCMSVVIPNPSKDDIVEYCKIYHFEDYARLKNHLIYKCIKTMGDVEAVLSLKPDELEYFGNLSSVIAFSDSTSSIVYTLSHYPNKGKTPINIVLRYILLLAKDPAIQRFTIMCLDEIKNAHIAEWCALAMYVMRCKRYKL